MPTLGLANHAAMCSARIGAASKSWRWGTSSGCFGSCMCKSFESQPLANPAMHHCFSFRSVISLPPPTRQRIVLVQYCRLPLAPTSRGWLSMKHRASQPTTSPDSFTPVKLNVFQYPPSSEIGPDPPSSRRGSPPPAATNASGSAAGGSGAGGSCAGGSGAGGSSSASSSASSSSSFSSHAHPDALELEI